MSTTTRVRELVDALRSNLAALDMELGPASPPITIRVGPGDDLQDAFESLWVTGGVILAQPGLYRVNLSLGARFIRTPIVFTTDTQNLPAAGVRMTRDFLQGLAVLKSADGFAPAVEIRRESGGFTFTGIGFAPQVSDRTVVALGDDQLADPSLMPTDILFDRVIALGDPLVGQHRFIMAHAKNVALTNSYCGDFFEVGRDSQVIAAWNGGHTVLVDNNVLEGGAENLMLGGSDAKSAAMIPSNWRITRNLFTKNPAWQKLATLPSIKTLLELKNNRRVHIEGNVFQNNWNNGKPGGSWASGVAVTFKVSPNGSPWTVGEDLTFINNVIRHVGSVFVVVGSRDGGEPSSRMTNLRIENNLAYDVGSADWPGDGKFLAIANPPLGLRVVHNTAFNPGTLFDWWHDGVDRTGTGLVFTDNVLEHGEYGVRCDDANGTLALDLGWPNEYQFTRNAIRQHPDRTVLLPAGNAVIDGAAFDASLDGYAVKPGSPVGAVAANIGVDLVAVRVALAPTETL